MSTINNSTRFIFSEDSTYPLSFSQIKARHSNTSFPAEPTAELMATFGYFVVAESAKPVGDVVTELDPVWDAVDNTYKRAFEGRAFTAEEVADQLEMRRAELLNEVLPLRVAALEIGAPFSFGVVLGTDYGTQHIQLRDGDRANIIGLRIESESEIAAGSVEYTGVRTYENNLVPLTHPEMVDLSWKVISAYKEVMKLSWDLEDAIKAAQSLAEFPEMPATLTPTLQARAV